MMTAYLLDTNVVDLIEAEPELLDDVVRRIRAGVLRLVVTHVQWDELAAIPLDHDRARLLAALERLAPEATPTAGAVYGVSRYGQATYFDEAGGARHRAYVGRSARRAKDALLLATAEQEGLPFLTAEAKPRNLRRMARFFPRVRIARLDELR